MESRLRGRPSRPLPAARAGHRRTILVLEDDDLALSNESEVGAAFREPAEGLGVPPDEVYWVDAWSEPFLATRLHLTTQGRLPS